MDEAAEVRAELRSYALRRCIRFYSALLLFAALSIARVLERGYGEDNALAALGVVLFGVLAVVEGASGAVMADMAKVRARHPGPETPLWLFAQGPLPSWIATVLFASLSVHHMTLI